MGAAEPDSTNSEDGAQSAARGRFYRDFATVCAGYIVGHGVLRFFAGFLIGLGDQPRAALIERWIPLWNAVGFFVLAWGVYYFLRRLERRAAASQPLAQPAAAPPTPRVAADEVAPDWKARLKLLQKRKDVGAIVDLQQSLAKSLPKERAEQIDRRLGRWFTKHFQRVMLNGRAAESADDVERVAAYYENSQEFGYFREILPIVRQCAELKQSIKDEDEEE